MLISVKIAARKNKHFNRLIGFVRQLHRLRTVAGIDATLKSTKRYGGMNHLCTIPRRRPSVMGRKKIIA